jgi:hypothetical protein
MRDPLPTGVALFAVERRKAVRDVAPRQRGRDSQESPRKTVSKP